MVIAIIRCESTPGMFSDERAVSVMTSDGRRCSFFADAVDLVPGGDAVMLPVVLEDGERFLVRFPKEGSIEVGRHGTVLKDQIVETIVT